MSENTIESGSRRGRNFTFIVYPTLEQLEACESETEYDGVAGYGTAPDDWREVLQRETSPLFVSPLHDRDLNPDGTVKKPHWHVIITYKGKKSLSTVKELTDSINSPGPQIVGSMEGAVRYLAHLDNPEKAQYDVTGVECYCGADLYKYLNESGVERYKMMSAMMDWVQDTGCTELSVLMDYARAEHFQDWFRLLCDGSLSVLNNYIRSVRHGGRVLKEVHPLVPWLVTDGDGVRLYIIAGPAVMADPQSIMTVGLWDETRILGCDDQAVCGKFDAVLEAQRAYEHAITEYIGVIEVGKK